MIGPVLSVVIKRVCRVTSSLKLSAENPPGTTSAKTDCASDASALHSDASDVFSVFPAFGAF